MYIYILKASGVLLREKIILNLFRQKTQNSKFEEIKKFKLS